jgi:hypothetical protein
VVSNVGHSTSAESRSLLTYTKVSIDTFVQ